MELVCVKSASVVCYQTGRWEVEMHYLSHHCVYRAGRLENNGDKGFEKTETMGEVGELFRVGVK
jgi:hypothetical protein